MDDGNFGDERAAAPVLASYRDSAPASFLAPPTEWIARRARQRTRRRVVLAAAALAVTMGGAVLFALHRAEPAPVGPAEPTNASPSLTPAPSQGFGSASPGPEQPGGTSTPPAGSATVDIRRVDWRNTTMRLPANRDDPDCPTGRITTKGETTPTSKGSFSVHLAPAYGDLTGDGQPEAVLYVACRTVNYETHETGQLMVVTQRAGELVGLAYVGPLDQVYREWKVTRGQLVVTLNQVLADPDTTLQTRTYRWDGTRFVQVAGPTTFPS
jgi:hypothetical protein